ncbi:MAG: hypothetical protein QF511_06830 [Rhodospirillales bacterium]|jgi:hypothetical protein|nr:hypothetical protein [Rhodospirillales bacterium]HIJ93922.1 hypothetical protein [Rhodospirillaceae bacterium]
MKEPVFFQRNEPTMSKTAPARVTDHSQALALLADWEVNDIDQDEKDWPSLKEGLEEHRLSKWKLFDG